MDDKIVRPFRETVSPSRSNASFSTVTAGSTSVSMVTGETVGSQTRISGRLLLPTNIPVFSDEMTLLLLHALRVERRRCASASFIVDSMVAMALF
jgi:hypothetical protein